MSFYWQFAFNSTVDLLTILKTKNVWFKKVFSKFSMKPQPLKPIWFFGHQIFFLAWNFLTQKAIFNSSQWVHKKLIKKKQKKTLTDAEIFVPWLSSTFFMTLISGLQGNEFFFILRDRNQEKFYDDTKKARIANWPLLFNLKSFLRFWSADTSGNWNKISSISRAIWNNYDKWMRLSSSKSRYKTMETSHLISTALLKQFPQAPLSASNLEL